MYFAGQFILDLCDFASDEGIATKDEILIAAGKTDEELSQKEALVDYQTVSMVFELLKERQDDPCLGLRMGEQISLRATRFVDQLMDHCSTVQEAFENAVAYSKLISDSMQSSLEVEADSFCVKFELNPDWALYKDYAINQNMDMALICAKKALNRLTQKSHYPNEVNFHYPKPKRLNDHFRLFNCHLNFNQPVSSIVFNKHLLKEASQHHNHGLLEKLEFEAADMLENLPHENTFIRTVKRSLLKRISPTPFNIEDIAGELNLTPRSLQRKLKDHKTGFRDLHNELRMKLVTKIMTGGYDNLDELAYLVGYSEASALVRAFKKHTGKSPKKYLAGLR